jgi:tellurite resistance protein TerC
MRLTLRQARKLIVAVIGTTVLIAGLVLLVTPGPAFVVIPIGLGILATEFIWAQRLLKKVKDKTLEAVDSVRKGMAEKP